MSIGPHAQWRRRAENRPDRSRTEEVMFHQLVARTWQGAPRLRRRRDLFPPDRALQARMAAALLAAAASAAVLVAVVGWLAATVQWRLAAGVMLFEAGGL